MTYRLPASLSQNEYPHHKCYRPSLMLASVEPSVVHEHFLMAQRMAAYLYSIARQAYDHGEVRDALRFQEDAALWSSYSRRIQHGEDS